MAALTSAGRKTGTSGGVCGRLWQGRQARAEHSLGQSRLSSTYPAPLCAPPLQSVFNGLILVPSQPPLQARREYTALIHRRRCT